MNYKKITLVMVCIALIGCAGLFFNNLTKRNKNNSNIVSHVSAAFPEIKLEDLKSQVSYLAKIKVDKFMNYEETNYGIVENGKQPTSNYSVNILECYKGDIKNKSIVLKVFGGYQNGIKVMSAEAPKLEIGKEYIVFLEKIENEYYMIPGWYNGIFEFKNGKYINQSQSIATTFEEIIK